MPRFSRLCQYLSIITLVVFLATPAMAAANNGRLAIGPKVSTLGVGAEAALNLNERLDARLGVNAFDYSYDGTEDDIEYEIDAELRNLSALIDWFPFANSFRLSAGAVFNDNALDGTAKSSATYDIGGTTYSLAQVGTLNADASFNPVAPYFGIGWGRPFARASRWSINVEVGAMYQGAPDTDLTATGPIATDPSFQIDLSEEEQELENEIDKYEFYPVVSLAVLYRF